MDEQAVKLPESAGVRNTDELMHELFEYLLSLGFAAYEKTEDKQAVTHTFTFVEKKIKVTEPRAPYTTQTATLPVEVRLVEPDLLDALQRNIARLTAQSKTYTLMVVYDPHTARYALYEGVPRGII